MGKCKVCGNEYDKSFVIEKEGNSHEFDCFECAIHALAPVCTNCGVKVLGHGHESDTGIFCSAFCASKQGVHELQDRV